MGHHCECFCSVELCAKKQSLLGHIHIVVFHSYMDPAYTYNGRMSPKFDTYSLGLIIVQLCCQTLNVQSVLRILQLREENSTIQDVVKLFRNHLVASDSTCRDLLQIGLECCQTEPKDRPDLITVLQRMEKLEKQVSFQIGTFPCTPFLTIILLISGRCQTL